MLVIAEACFITLELKERACKHASGHAVIKTGVHLGLHFPLAFQLGVLQAAVLGHIRFSLSFDTTMSGC